MKSEWLNLWIRLKSAWGSRNRLRSSSASPSVGLFLDHNDFFHRIIYRVEKQTWFKERSDTLLMVCFGLLWSARQRNNRTKQPLSQFGAIPRDSLDTV